jgi:hypothetical protein
LENILCSHQLFRNVKIRTHTIIIIIIIIIIITFAGACLAFEEERIFRVFENRVLRRIFGPQREEIAGGWRRLHNTEFNNLY